METIRSDPPRMDPAGRSFDGHTGEILRVCSALATATKRRVMPTKSDRFLLHF